MDFDSAHFEREDLVLHVNGDEGGPEVVWDRICAAIKPLVEADVLRAHAMLLDAAARGDWIARGRGQALRSEGLLWRAKPFSSRAPPLASAPRGCGPIP